jgi:hypothetical protein
LKPLSAASSSKAARQPTLALINKVNTLTGSMKLKRN